MDIKVFKNPNSGNENVPINKEEAVAPSEEKKTMVRELSNGSRLIREGDTFYAAVGDEKIEISREEAVIILQNHDLIYDVIIEAKRKFYFNTAEDRYSPSEY